jgi:hypothetical protein
MFIEHDFPVPAREMKIVFHLGKAQRRRNFI